MRRFKKLLGLLLTFTIMFTILMSTVYAEQAVPPVPSKPDKTSVTIHKIVSTSELELKNADGNKIDNISELWPGTDAAENNTGVQFTVWNVPEGSTVDDFGGYNSYKLNNYDSIVVNAGESHDFENGTYYVKETKFPENYVSSTGVPFIMKLPVYNAAGDARLKELHIYPKNVIKDNVTIDKDVKTKNQDHAGFDIGQNFDYLIYPKVPKGIENYTKFEVSDRLDSTLDYMGSVSITYNKVTFNKDTDYTLTEDTIGNSGGRFSVSFTADGLKKLSANRPVSETEKDLEIKFQARINKTATMGKEIYNDAVLTYNNKTIDVPEDKRPEVHTGGRKFIKIDKDTMKFNSELSSAAFYVKNSAGQYMNNDSGMVTWVSDPKNATKITVNQSDGTFEVKGLAYADNGDSYIYKLEEAVVPNDYIKMDDMDFDINENSYDSHSCYGNYTNVTNAKRPKIPQTGGVGTVIFLIAGLTLMSAAVIALKKKQISEK